MSKEQKNNKAPESDPVQKEQQETAATQAQAEGAGEAETPSAQAKEAETFTVTKEQMEKMEGLAGQLAALNDQHLRLMAEYDNYRKRTQKEKESIYQDAKADTIQKFLEVYDNLERAVSQEGDEDNVHKKGMTMIFHELEGILTKLGVTVVNPVGEAFDPEKHNAVLHIEDESLGENVVSQVFQKGFLLGDKVIRHATVQVAN